MRIQQQIKIARIFFILSAFYGLLLRLYPHFDFVPFNYRNILEGHSHVAFLGWGFLAVISLIGHSYFPQKLNDSKRLEWFFKTMVFSLFGLLISFPLQGYSFLSIIFLSIFLITSYFYLYHILKELKTEVDINSRFIKTGILFYFLSSLAIWSIGYIVALYGKYNLYYNAIYFYLHFLYNGFFVFTLFGLFFRYISTRMNTQNLAIKPFYFLTIVACVLGYSLSLLWTDHHSFVTITAIFSASLQIFSLYYFWLIIRKVFAANLSKQVRFILFFVAASFILKILLQFLSIFPDLFYYVVIFKSTYIIGYIHLFTLGFLSPMIFLLFSGQLKIELDKYGLILYLIGFTTTEILLFSQGIAASHFSTQVPYYYYLIVVVSLLLFIGLLLIYFKSKKRD